MVGTLGAREVLAHLEVIRETARALCMDRQDAEDLVQETCARVLSRERTVHSEHHAAYLAAAVRNTYFDACRRARSRPVAMRLDAVHGTAAIATREGVPPVELRALIDTLPDGQRKAVLAVDVLGMPYAEAARSLNVPTGTIMSRLCRARRVLAAQLQA